MMFLYYATVILLLGFIMGCYTYCGVKIYRLPHLPPHWGLYVSLPFFAVAAYALITLVTAGLAARQIVRLSAAVVMAAAIGVTTAFFFGWINGVGHKPEAKNDPE